MGKPGITGMEIWPFVCLANADRQNSPTLFEIYLVFAFLFLIKDRSRRLHFIVKEM